MDEIVLINPITHRIKNSINKSINKLNIASPFLSSFVRIIFNVQYSKKILKKRLITRFDDTNLLSFDLPTLKYLLDLGFKIKYDNNIHLKLYITDSDAFITSSNLTKGGFEDNVELTVKIDSDNNKYCNNIFKEIWKNCGNNYITYELIKSNNDKYEVLKKREKITKKEKINLSSKNLTNYDLDIQIIIDKIFELKKDYSKTLNLEFEANKLREKKINNLRNGFHLDLFYAPMGDSSRNKSLFYDFAYGYESKLAGAGLRESQYRSVFEHRDFEKVVNYIFPEMIGMTPWNFQDKTVLREFCEGIFDFEIQEYSEVIPIRLISYFYPNLFLPIYKLDHLKKICEVMGIDSNAKTKGDKLYTYNLYISDKMKLLPYNNYIKMHISYVTCYTVELYNRLKKKEDYDAILKSYPQKWMRDNIKEGKQILIDLGKIN